jgi:hypothetical protein
MVQARLEEVEATSCERHEKDTPESWEAVRGKARYLSTFGVVRLWRRLYRDRRNGPTVSPLERSVGIVEGFWTPQAAKLAALAVSDMTPHRAEGFFAAFGAMTPSKSSLDRLPKALSERWEANRLEFEQELRTTEGIPAEAVTVAVSNDGVMVPMRGESKADRKRETRSEGRPDKGPTGYKEVGCGAISFYDSDGERLKTIRFGRMPESKMTTLVETLRADLAHIRIQRPDLAVVALADGSPNNWDFLGSLDADEEVVDFYHATEHLKRAVDVTYGACAVTTQKKFQKLRLTLRDKDNGVGTVIRSLAQKRPCLKSKGSKYRSTTRYFQRHRHRMDYARLQKANLPIGSGVMEGTCKSIASDRLKRAGMRWDIPGGQAILTLRAAVHSERFDRLWRLLAETYRSA